MEEERPGSAGREAGLGHVRREALQICTQTAIPYTNTSKPPLPSPLHSCILHLWHLQLTYTYNMHTIDMKITWDKVKAKSNRLKHRTFFSEVVPVFYDPNAISFEDKRSVGESRYIMLGLDALARIVVVVFTYQGVDIRLISARKASKSERKAYEKRIRL
jgi:uncharacterized DUF497 family protein